MKKFLAVPFLAVLLSGCSAMRPIHPGAVNVFDSNAFDTLDVTHGVIENTKIDLAANTFPATLVPQIKIALNDLIAAYDVADTAYITYHAAAVAGTVTQAQIDAVSAGLTKVNSTTNALVTIKGNH